jgi:hypothetical protein
MLQDMHFSPIDRDLDVAVGRNMHGQFEPAEF